MIQFQYVLKNATMEAASIAMIAIFVQNIVFTRALGTSASLFVLRKKYNLGYFSLIMTVITTLSCCLVFFMNPLIQKLPNAYYWKPFFYVLAVGVVYVLVLLSCAMILKSKIETIRPMIHLSAFNGAVFGALLLQSSMKLTFLTSLAFGLGTGIGFLLASYLIALGYERLNSDKIPRAFRGFPITLVYIGILSLAFYGLIGHELSM